MAEAITVGETLESIRGWLPSVGDWFASGFDNLITWNWLDLTWPQVVFTIFAAAYAWIYFLDIVGNWKARPKVDLADWRSNKAEAIPWYQEGEEPEGELNWKVVLIIIFLLLCFLYGLFSN